MQAYDLYGTTLENADQVRDELEAILGCTFEARTSDYVGEYYRCSTVGEESISIKENRGTGVSEPLEEDFPERKILVYVDDTERSSALMTILLNNSSKFQLLRHEEF